MRYLFFTLFLPFVLCAQEGDYQILEDTTVPRELQIDQLSLDLSIAFDLRFKRVDGDLNLRFIVPDNPVDSLWLDGPGILIDSLYSPETAVKFETYKKGIAVFPEVAFVPETNYTLNIRYRAWPKKGLYFVNHGEFHWQRGVEDAPKQIWTQGQGIDHRHWIPHVDAQNDKLLTSLTVTFDTGYAVVSNGLLKEYEVIGDQATWRYAMEKPHSSYLIMLAIGDYDLIVEGANGTRILNFYYPEWKDRYATTYFKNGSVFRFLEKEIGTPYPWQEYKQVPVMNFQHGAMENTSATIFGDFFCVDSISFNDRNYVGVNAHELAHQWFGNLVTATHSTHHWLHEGFASYYAWMAEEHVFGEERFALLRKQSLENVLAAEARDMFPLAHGNAGSERFYDKGAWVLLMLRNEVGDSAWHMAITDYLKQHEYGMVQTPDLRQAMEEASGKDLNWFFEQWVYRPQIPRLTMKIETEKRSFNVTFTQNLMEGQEPYLLHFPLKIKTSQREFIVSFTIAGETANYSAELDKKERLLAVIPDPDFELLATWEVDAELFYLENLASIVSDSACWFFGTEPMLNHPKYNSGAAGFVVDAHVLKRQTYAAGLAKRLAQGKGIDRLELSFIEYESDLNVIKAFLQNSNILQPELLPVAEKWLALPSYEIKELALMRLCISDKKNAKKYLDATDGIMGTSGHNVRITWLLLHTAFVNQSTMKELVDFTGPNYDFVTRMSAFQSLQSLGYINYKSVNHAMGSLFQGNRKLKITGRQYIKGMAEEEAGKKEIQFWVNRNKDLLSPDELDNVKHLTGFAPTE